MMKTFMVLFTLATLATNALAGNEDDVTKTFTVQRGGTLEMNVQGEVRISTSDKNELIVSVSGIEKGDEEKLKFNQIGNTVTVDFRQRGNRQGMWNWGRSHSSSSDNIRFEIQVPREFNLEIKTSGGGIELTSNLTGNVRWTTGGGDLRFPEIMGSVDFATSGGNIRGSVIKGNGYMRTSGGDIKIETTSGMLEVKTSGGDITIGSVGKTLRASTSGGDIRAESIGDEARLTTSGGDIRVGKASAGISMATSGGNIELRGAQGNVIAKTSGGSLRLENITGTVEAKTSGGDIYAEITPSGTGGSYLSSSAGEVELRISESAKATIEAQIRGVVPATYLSFPDGSGKIKRHRIGNNSFEVRSDFPAKNSGEEDASSNISAIYQLNGGGQIITVETMHGNIAIRKLKK